MDKPKVGPKDFFMYLGGLAALYVSVVSLITLLFQYVNILFPDTLSYYPEGYSSSVRFAIASLIIVFPLYIVLTRFLNQDLRRNPEKKGLWIRTWLIFLTLFVGGITIIIDLVVLINTFLGGEVTMRLVLKVLAVLIVVGAAFIYYFLDLKGVWERNEKRSAMFGIGAVLAVLLTIAGGFILTGSPQTQRLLAFDRQKTNDLQTIQYQVVNYWQQKQALPKTLAELEDPISGFRAPFDPQTKEPYGYTVKGKLSFELCGTFNKEAQASDAQGAFARPVMSGYGSDALANATWEHGVSKQCFARTIDPDLYPPRKQ
jgi:hypothetical protein